MTERRKENERIRKEARGKTWGNIPVFIWTGKENHKKFPGQPLPEQRSANGTPIVGRGMLSTGAWRSVWMEIVVLLQPIGQKQFKSLSLLWTQIFHNIFLLLAVGTRPPNEDLKTEFTFGIPKSRWGKPALYWRVSGAANCNSGEEPSVFTPESHPQFPANFPAWLPAVRIATGFCNTRSEKLMKMPFLLLHIIFITSFQMTEIVRLSCNVGLQFSAHKANNHEFVQSRVRLPLKLLGLSIDLTLPAGICPCDRLRL